MPSDPPVTSTQPKQSPRAPRKVPSACQRCKRQKLKCDIQRPCTLCVRAGVDCCPTKPNVWRISGSGQAPLGRHNDGPNTRRPGKRRRLLGEAKDQADPSTPRPRQQQETLEASTTVCSSADSDEVADLPIVTNTRTATSSAIGFVEEAFNDHDVTSPGGPETSAFSAAQWARRESSGPGETPSSNPPNCAPRVCKPRGAQQLRVGRLKTLSLAEVELSSLLPDQSVATLLVENYFARIHWFVLVFHQSDFRVAFRQLYHDTSPRSIDLPSRLGFMSVFLAACVTSLQYLNSSQEQELRGHGIEASVLQEKILNSLKLRLLDIVSLGSIEAVQVCVMMGSFYLFHGEPDLAWPICGSGLRIAQALNLHRGSPLPKTHPPDLDDPIQRAEETRKRCWWAIYEIETFCSMLYGFPLNINDSDCDIPLMDPYPLRSKDPSWDAGDCQAKGRATLLSYKHCMATLSIIVKSALTDLYGLREKASHTSSSQSGDDGNRLRGTVKKVASIDARLNSWYLCLPSQLRPDAEFPTAPSSSTTNVDSFQQGLFELQALALKLAFESTRILVHRPLLSYRTARNLDLPGQSGGFSQLPTLDPFRSSIRACRDAALRISSIGSTAIFKQASSTYAVSFVSLHLFTAGVALSIMTNLQPLSEESHEAKMGLRRLMEMQSRLKSNSLVAEQGLGILKKLMSLIISKETRKMFDFESEATEGSQSRGIQGQRECLNQHSNQEQEISQQRISPDPRINTGVMENAYPGSEAEPIDMAQRGFMGSLEVYEDPLMTEALQDFEQAMNFGLRDETEEIPFFNSNDPLTSSCFNAQDQGWIWGFNHGSRSNEDSDI